MHEDYFHQHCAADRGGDHLHLPAWTVDDWRALLSRATPVALGRGEVLMKSGQSERALYLVAAGTLEVTAAGAGEAMGRLVREEPGSVFGEISFFDGGPRTATVWATQPAQLLRLDHAGWCAFAAERPQRGQELLFALARVLALRMRQGGERRGGALGYA